MEIYDPKKLNDEEVQEEFQIKIWNSFMTMENSDGHVHVSFKNKK